MKKCKVLGCNNAIWSRGLCKYHSPSTSFKKRKKPITKKVINKKLDEIDKMRNLFLSIWKKRGAYSEVSNVYLGREPLTIYFHHILPKHKYKEAAFDEENIIILTGDEHADYHKYEEIEIRKKKLLKKYNYE